MFQRWINVTLKIRLTQVAFAFFLNKLKTMQLLSRKPLHTNDWTGCIADLSWFFVCMGISLSWCFLFGWFGLFCFGFFLSYSSCSFYSKLLVLITFIDTYKHLELWVSMDGEVIVLHVWPCNFALLTNKKNNLRCEEGKK